MSDPIKIVYKCRACGEILTTAVSIKLESAPIYLEFAVNDASEKKFTARLYHKCREGEIGVADLIGARESGESFPIGDEVFV